MKKNLLSFFFAAFAATGFAQTATDFSTTDCDGNGHTLFTELDAGKVIVLNWVMPCSSCINGSLSAYNIVQGYASSNPGQVFHWLLDDNGGSTCTTLINWCNSYGIGPNNTIFQNTGNAANEANYGGAGMPHVCVVGPDHHIYFNGLGSAAYNPTGVTNAINQALLALGIHQTQNFSFHVNAVADSKNVKVNFTLSEPSNVKLDILNELGQSVATRDLGKQPAGKSESEFSLSGMSQGVYFVRFNSEKNSQTVRFTVSK